MSNPNRKRYSLTEALEELERTDPAVREASQRYDEFVLGESYRLRLYDGINARRAAEGKSPIGPFVKRERHGVQPPETP